MQELDLQEIRRQIDEVDRKLAEALASRLDLVMQVAAYKKSKNMPVKDKAREALVIEKVTSMVEVPEYKPAVAKIMRSIIDAACDLEEDILAHSRQELLKIGCFGSEGSFTHQALEEYFIGRNYERRHFNRFEEVISSVSSGELDYGILPIENSSTGGITEVYDLLRKYDCSIVGERCLRIEQNLLGCGGATMESIKKVYSHPQGFAQSKEFFKAQPQLEQAAYFSTSESAAYVAKAQNPALAAIAGKKAAQLYQLEIIAPNINYDSNNCTRFVIIAKNAEKNIRADKITLILALKHEPGSLYKMLGCFYHHGLNLINLESRPMDGKPWEYYFYIDITGNLEDNAVKDALEDVQKNSVYCKILGNYPADNRKD